MNYNSLKPCPSCKTKGSFIVEGYVIGRQRVLCPMCDGRGYVKDTPPDCYTTGKVLSCVHSKCKWLWACASIWRYQKDLEKIIYKDFGS